MTDAAMTDAVMTDAVRFFTDCLTFQTDVADVHTAMVSGDPGFVLVDTRSQAAWDRGHVPGAVHVPAADLPGPLDPASPVVTYCWGPGCNGATKAALALARGGYSVREMIGGFEYWAREGLPVESASGHTTGAPDPLTVACGC